MKSYFKITKTLFKDCWFLCRFWDYNQKVVFKKRTVKLLYRTVTYPITSKWVWNTLQNQIKLTSRALKVIAVVHINKSKFLFSTSVIPMWHSRWYRIWGQTVGKWYLKIYPVKGACTVGALGKCLCPQHVHQCYCINTGRTGRNSKTSKVTQNITGKPFGQNWGGKKLTVPKCCLWSAI